MAEIVTASEAWWELNFAQDYAGADAIVDHHGSLDAPYGEHHRVGRGEKTRPVGGAGRGPGTSTLRAMGDEQEERDGHKPRGGSVDPTAPSP